MLAVSSMNRLLEAVLVHKKEFPVRCDTVLVIYCPLDEVISHKVGHQRTV